MSKRHMQFDRPSNLRRRCASVVVALAAAVAGCNSASHTDSSTVHTAQDFCGPFLKYLRTDFPIDGVKLSYLGGTGKPDEPLDNKTFGLTCAFDSTTGSKLSGRAVVRPTKPDEDTSGLPAYVKQMNLVALPGHTKDIWIKDSRVKQGPVQTKGTVELATRIDPWVSTMEIIDEYDSLAITDAQIGKAADVLIQTTETLSK